MDDLTGKKYVFEDGMVLEVIQVRNKEIDGVDQPVVTFHTYNGRSLPRKLVMTKTQFIDTYGHLFPT